MDSYEKRLRDEVLYLHNLWHEGPPSNPNYQNPNSIQNLPPILPLYPSNSIPYSNNARSRKRRFHNGNNQPLGSDPSPVPEVEWPVVPQTWEETPGWPALKRQAPQAAQPVSADEQARLAALKIQQKALDASREFFTKRVSLDSEDEEESEEAELGDGCLELEDGSGGTEVHRFFMGVFVEDSELRSYYEKNHEGGEFCCLVCAAIGKKAWKRFKDCVGLIQHSTSISNTKKKLAHRAFGDVICKVLGWDIDRIPVIALKGEPLSCTLGKSQDELKGSNHDSNFQMDKVDARNDGNSEVVSNGSSETCLNNGKLISVPVEGHVELMVCKNSVKEADANKNGENTEKSSSDVGVNKVVDCLGSEPSEVSTIQRPCQNHVNESTLSSGLPTTKPESILAVNQASAEAKEEPNMQLQHKAVECCYRFFASIARSDGDKHKGKDGDVDDLMDVDRIEECEEFKFLLKVFTENDDLRRYYENKQEGAEYYCLVCGRRFKGCTGLLSHAATTTSKTKKIRDQRLLRAHRAYGRVICKVLAQDMPLANPSSSTQPQREPLKKDEQLQEIVG